MKYLRQEKGFYRRVLGLMLPLTAQNFITSSLSLADTFMVGVLGERELAAVTMANTPFFLALLLCFGLQSGVGVLVAQYHGRGGGMNAINRILGIGLWTSMGATFLLGLVAALFPEGIMRLLTNNESLVEPGAAYTRIVGFSYFFASISGMYLAIRRSMSEPRLGAVILCGSGILNIFLNWVLIFGKLGFPAMGVSGAALATLISRMLEVVAVIPCALRSKSLKLKAKLLLRPGREMGQDFVKYCLPVVCNELLWSLAFSSYSVILGHMPNNTPLLAAYTLVGNLDKMLTVAIFACGSAAAVIIGREIGMGHRETLYSKAMALNMVALGFGLLCTVLMLLTRTFLARQYLFPLMDFGAEASETALYMLLVLSIFSPLRSVTLTNIIGVFRGGGDVRYALYLDLIPMFAFCVPLAALTGLVLDLGIRVVYIIIYCDDVIKALIGLPRLVSGRWIHVVTREECT